MAQDIPRDFGQLVSQINRRLNRLERRPGQGGPRQITLPSYPTTGTWERGTLCWNSAPSPGGIMGWTCVVSGTPGVWRVFSNVSP